MTNQLDITKIRAEFPMLMKPHQNKPLIYLDNAATSQKPSIVIQRLHDFYENEYATIHRGIYSLSQEATDEYELAREKSKIFLNAADASEIIFVRGATEAINLVATAYGQKFIKSGQDIIISTIEHHANIIPWQQLCQRNGINLKIIPVNDKGELIMVEYKKLLSDNTALVAVGHVSNALGTINPVKEIIALAHEVGAKVLIDGAQAVSHMKVDVLDLDCDFYCFSGHKVFGPTGIGVLYGKADILDAMDPYQFGGEMIEIVTFEKTTFAKSPLKFEAGTTAIVQAIGLGVALDYVTGIGFDGIAAAEKELLDYATTELTKIPDLELIGTAEHKSAVLSFEIKDIHPHDIGTVLDQQGIAIRAGHHCAQPTMQRFKVAATARASLAFYNTKDEIDALIKGLYKVKEVFK